jgi:DNA-binding Lrp family transcriptional regulator
MAFDDVPWFDFDEQVQGILALIDGVRTIAEIARRTATSPGELQLRIADLRDRGVIRVE